MQRPAPTHAEDDWASWPALLVDTATQFLVHLHTQMLDHQDEIAESLRIDPDIAACGVISGGMRRLAFLLLEHCRQLDGAGGRSPRAAGGRSPRGADTGRYRAASDAWHRTGTFDGALSVTGDTAAVEALFLVGHCASAWKLLLSRRGPLADIETHRFAPAAHPAHADVDGRLPPLPVSVIGTRLAASAHILTAVAGTLQEVCAERHGPLWPTPELWKSVAASAAALYDGARQLARSIAAAGMDATLLAPVAAIRPLTRRDDTNIPDDADTFTRRTAEGVTALCTTIAVLGVDPTHLTPPPDR